MDEHFVDDVDAYISEYVCLYQDRLISYVRSLIANTLDDPAAWKVARADPEDIVQQAFERTYISLSASRKILTNPFAYLRLTAKNVFIDLLRREKHEVKTEPLDLKKKPSIEEGEITLIEQSFSDNAHHPEYVVLDDENVRTIIHGITSIRSENIKKVMLLKSDGYSPGEIADKLALPEGSVKNYIHRGRGELLMYLESIEKQGEKIHER